MRIMLVSILVIVTGCWAALGVLQPRKLLSASRTSVEAPVSTAGSGFGGVSGGGGAAVSTNPALGPRLNGRIPAWPYGVRGDGKTDSTQALQDAIDAANGGRHMLTDTGPRYVELPAGTIRTTRPIALKSGVILIGSGSGIVGDHDGPVIELTATSGSGGSWIDGVEITNLAITGRGPGIAVRNDSAPRVVRVTAGGQEFHWAERPEAFYCVLDGPAWPAAPGGAKGYILEYWSGRDWKTLDTGDVSYSRRHLALHWNGKSPVDWAPSNGLWPLRLRLDNPVLRVIRGPWSTVPVMSIIIRDVQISHTQSGIDLLGGYAQHCLIDNVTCRGLAGGMLHLMGNANVITRMDRESGVRSDWQRPLAEVVVVGGGNSLRDNIVEGHNQECLGYFCSGWGVELTHNWLEGLKPYRGLTMLFEDCRALRVDALAGGPGFRIGLACVSGQVDNLGCYAGNPCRVVDCFDFLPPSPERNSVSVGLFMGDVKDPGDRRIMINGRAHLQSLTPIRE